VNAGSIVGKAFLFLDSRYPQRMRTRMVQAIPGMRNSRHRFGYPRKLTKAFGSIKMLKKKEYRLPLFNLETICSLKTIHSKLNLKDGI